MAKSRGRKFAEITSPTSGVFDLASVPTITNAKLQNSAMTLAGSSVSLGGTGVADTDALSEGSSNLYFTDARVQTFLGGGTLAGNIVVPDNRSIYIGSSSDFRIVHNTTNTQLINATGALQVTSNGGFDVTGAATFSSTIAATGAITANAGVVVDNITIDGTEIDLSSGDMTLDVAGDIILDADGGDILFKDGGTHWASLYTNGTNTYLQNMISDGDIYLTVNDGGSSVNALIIDGSNAGAAIFNDSVTSNSGFLAAGSSSSLQIQKSGSDGYINQSDSGDLIFRMGSGFSEKMRLDSSGNVGIGATAAFGSGSGLEVSRSGTATVRVERTGSTASSGEFFAGNGKVVLSSISNNHLEFRTNNTEAMRIDSSGNVGIGTTNPASVLHIEGNTNGYNTAPLIYFGSTSTANAAVRDWAIGPADSDYGNFHIFQGASTGAAAVGTSQIAFTIDKDKQVGIGTYTPSALLDIETAGNTADGTYYSTITINNTGSSTYSRLRFDRSASARWGIGLRNDDKFHIAKLFNTSSDDTFVIDSGGNVILNGNSPTQKFQVDGGNIRISNGYGYVWGDTTVQIYSNGSYLRMRTNATDRWDMDSNGRIIQTMTNSTASYLAYHFRRSQAEASGARVANYMEMRFTDTGVTNGTVNASIRAHSNTWYNSDMEMSFHSASGGNSYEVMRITAARDLSLQNEDTQVVGGFGAKTTAGTNSFNHSSNARSGNGYTLLRMDQATGGGAGGSAYYHVFNYEYASRDSDGNMTQIAIGYNDNRQFMRYRYGGSWSSWHEM